MLSLISGDSARVFTVYSNQIAIGGLTAAEETRWYWAIFALKDQNIDSKGYFSPLGGSEHSLEDAYVALESRWNAWLDSAGLGYADDLSSDAERGERRAAAPS